MRKPKWTYDEMIRHFVWRITDRNIHIESAEDRDEYEFCENFYAKDPEIAQREAIRHRQYLEQSRILIAECEEVARAIIAGGESCVIETLFDTTQHNWVKWCVLASHEYSRRVIDHVLTEGEPWLKWLLLDHPLVTVTDLQRVADDDACAGFVQMAALRALATRSNQFPSEIAPRLAS